MIKEKCVICQYPLIYFENENEFEQLNGVHRKERIYDKNAIHLCCFCSQLLNEENRKINKRCLIQQWIKKHEDKYNERLCDALKHDCFFKEMIRLIEIDRIEKFIREIENEQ